MIEERLNFQQIASLANFNTFFLLSSENLPVIAQKNVDLSLKRKEMMRIRWFPRRMSQWILWILGRKQRVLSAIDKKKQSSRHSKNFKILFKIHPNHNYQKYPKGKVKISPELEISTRKTIQGHLQNNHISNQQTKAKEVLPLAKRQLKTRGQWLKNQKVRH